MKITHEIDDTLAWEGIFGALAPASTPWLVDYVFLAGDWDKPGKVKITMWDGSHEDNDPAHFITDTFNLHDMEDAYQIAATKGYTHCGGCPIIDVENPDACSAEMLLQCWRYGSVVYS